LGCVGILLMSYSIWGGYPEWCCAVCRNLMNIDGLPLTWLFTRTTGLGWATRMKALWNQRAFGLADAGCCCDMWPRLWWFTEESTRGRYRNEVLASIGASCTGSQTSVWPNNILNDTWCAVPNQNGTKRLRVYSGPQKNNERLAAVLTASPWLLQWQYLILMPFIRWHNWLGVRVSAQRNTGLR